MKEAVVATVRAATQRLRALLLGLRRGVVAVCAATAMVVIYGLGSIGSYGLSVAGISSLALVSSATKADARRRRRRRRGWGRRRHGIWLWVGPHRRRRRRWRRRRRRGIYLYW